MNSAVSTGIAGLRYRCDIQVGPVVGVRRDEVTALCDIAEAAQGMLDMHTDHDDGTHVHVPNCQACHLNAALKRLVLSACCDGLDGLHHEDCPNDR